MGFFDKAKKMAQQAMAQVAGQSDEVASSNEAEVHRDDFAQGTQDVPATQQVAPQNGFSWDGDVYAWPSGWDGLSMTDWFYRMAELSDRMMHIDQESVAEMTDEDGDPLDEEEAFLIQHYGFANGGTFEAYKMFMVTQFAQQQGVSWEQCWGTQSGVAHEKLMATKASAMRSPGGSAGALLDPIEGVALETWAQLQARLAGGGNLDALLSEVGIDKDRWDRVSNEWMSRMSADTSMTISTVYGNAFSSAGQGQFASQAGQAATHGVGGDLSDEPVSFERFCEITAVQETAAERGEDPNACLAGLGLTALDWSNIGAFWSKKIQTNPTHYVQEMQRLKAKYSQG